jgi:hypothetical protein
MQMLVLVHLSRRVAVLDDLPTATDGSISAFIVADGNISHVPSIQLPSYARTVPWLVSGRRQPVIDIPVASLATAGHQCCSEAIAC